MINTIIANLRDRRQSLLKKAAELDGARQLVQPNAKTGQISIEKANAETSKIAAERSTVDAVLAEPESIIAELIAGLPLQLTTPTAPQLRLQMCSNPSDASQQRPTATVLNGLCRLLRNAASTSDTPTATARRFTSMPCRFSRLVALDCWTTGGS
jgi:hypothetical protein